MSRAALRAALAALAVAAAAPVAAHETLHEVARGKAIAVKALFADGEVLAYTTYEVYSPADPKIPHQKGRTDRAGWLAFVPDAPGRWRVKVIDETGHGLDLEVEAAAPAGAGQAAPAAAPSSAAFVLRPLVGLAAIAAVFAALYLFYRRKGEDAVTRHLARLAAALSVLAAAPALAHHGTAAVSAIGAEGPGAALDTTSPLPLGQGTLFALGKTEYAAFQQRSGFEDQKRYAAFNTLAVGYGLTPWLSAFLFQPYNWKSQDGMGTNSGLGDTNLMLSAAFKWDAGLGLAPEKESLDDLADWHFGLWLACSLPLGSTTHRDDAGDLYAPDMQTGFNGPSPAVGLSVLKQLSPDLTALGEVSHQRFFDQAYPRAGYRYQFGAETRLNAALVYRAWASGANRLDLAPELSLLDLQRDQAVVALEASGGTILYGQLGARITLGRLSIGASVKRAVARSLHEGADQQGSEGLESYRAALVLGYSTRL